MPECRWKQQTPAEMEARLTKLCGPQAPVDVSTMALHAPSRQAAGHAQFILSTDRRGMRHAALKAKCVLRREASGWPSDGLKLNELAKRD